MFKTELREFTFETASGKLQATLPTSLYSVLSDSGVIINPYYRDEEEKRFLPMSSACEISTVFKLSSDAAKLKFAYIKIPELDAEAEVFFNGKSIFTLAGKRSHILDVSAQAKSGENTITIKVPASDYPRDITLFDKLEFIAFSRALIGGISAKPTITSEGVSVDVALELLGDGSEIKAVATLMSPTGKIYYGGVTNGRTVINISDPLLWWPSGYGVQNLYRLTVNLYYENESIDSGELTLGLRSLFCDGRSGVGFTVNGNEFFAMGAEYKASGKTPSYDLRKKADELVTAVARANMNFIRFNGQGRYPCEEFLTLCDSFGIMVECVLGNERLKNLDPSSLRRELASNFKRMSKHPSLLAVSYDKTALTEERSLIVNEAKSAALSAVFVLETDGSDSFVPSVSVPNGKTLASVLEAEDMNIFSYVMEHHMSSPAEASKMLSLAAESYKYAHGVDELTYMSGILAAHAYESYVDGARLKRNSVGSAVLYSLNDSKPSLSRAMIDFGTRFKASYYRARQIFAPIKLILSKENGLAVSFTLSNESKKSASATVRYALKDAENNSVYSGSLTLSADKYSVSNPISLDLSEYIVGHEREYYLEYVMLLDSGRVSSGAHLFVAPKHFRFADPVILSEISGSGREFTLTVRASALAKDVMFDFLKTDAVFEENCIDLTDSSVRRIAFTTVDVMSAEKLMSELRIMSVFNIGRDA